jgi:chromatin segregation and condensation protein Rec8/ScpA/Scc1 (kleisin family)
MNKENLAKAIFDVIKNLPKFEKKPQVKITKVISLEEMITNLTDRVKRHMKMGFREFSGMGKADKVNVIVSFLAMLELVKQGMIEVSQRDKFEDIHMETKTVGVPTY